MAARKRRDVVKLDPSDLDPSEVTSRITPEGTPQNPDGSIAAEGEMDVTEMRRVGAATVDAAMANKRNARKVDAAVKGQPVKWNEKDPLILFDLLRAPFGNSLQLCIKDTATQVAYPPCPLSMFRSNMDFYKHLQKLHAGKPQSQYEIIFKDIGNYTNRGIGFITMPDALEEAPAQQTAPSPWGQPPQPWQLPQWPPNQYMPQQQPPPVPMPAPVATAPIPTAQPQQPQMPIMLPPGTDPAVVAALQQMQRSQQATQEQITTLMMQLSGALGGLEEFKRAALQREHAPAPVQAVQGLGAPPPPPPVEPYRTAVQQPPPPPPQRVFLGYGENGQPVYGYAAPPSPPPAQQPQAFGAPPPPPPAPVAASVMPAARALSPLEQMAGLASMVASAQQGLEAVRKAVGAPGSKATAVEEEPDQPEIAEPVEEHYRVVPLGDPNDPKTLSLTHDRKGDIAWQPTLMGNLPKLATLFSGMAEAALKVNGAVETAQRTRPITVQGHAVPVSPTVAIPPAIPVRTAQ